MQMGQEFGEEFGAEGPPLDYVMAGIPDTSLATTVSAVVTVNVTKKFRAERLCLTAAARTALVKLNSISISSEEQIISPDGVDAELFTTDATHMLKGTLVTPGVGIRLSVTNGSAGTILFGGAFFGPADYRNN